MKRSRRGIILFTALVIAGIMMAWAIAATHRANFTTGAAGFSYRKSEVYYLAKTAMSRGLNNLNSSASWASAHSSRGSADSSTQGTLCWVEPGGRPDSLMLRCEAKIGSHVETLSVPVLRQEGTDTQIYSIAPAYGGGPDLIAWSTVSADVWETLPPIPGADKILSVCSTPNGDLYAIGKSPTSTALWRYRTGQGWIQMPDTPPGVTISMLSAGGDKEIVCLASDNTLLTLTLPSDSSSQMEWGALSPPAGTTLTNVAAHPAGEPFAYASATDPTGKPVLLQYVDSTGSWVQLPPPTPTVYNAATGASTASSAGSVPNYAGGVAVTRDGKIYAASNPAGSASVVYEFQPSAAGSNVGTWRTLPAVPALEWQPDNSVASPNGFASDLKHLRSDDEGKLWAQSTNPVTGKYSVIQIDPAP